VAVILAVHGSENVALKTAAPSSIVAMAGTVTLGSLLLKDATPASEDTRLHPTECGYDEVEDRDGAYRSNASDSADPSGYKLSRCAANVDIIGV